MINILDFAHQSYLKNLFEIDLKYTTSNTSSIMVNFCYF